MGSTPGQGTKSPHAAWRQKKVCHIEIKQQIGTHKSHLLNNYIKCKRIFFSSNSLATHELWCWRRLLRVPWTARRSNQSILKISPEYSSEGLMLKLKLWYFGHVMWRNDSLEKTLMLGKIEGGRRRVKWHHWFDGHEFEQAPGIGDGQGSLACCSPWGCRIRHNWVTELNWATNGCTNRRWNIQSGIILAIKRNGALVQHGWILEILH